MIQPPSNLVVVSVRLAKGRVESSQKQPTTPLLPSVEFATFFLLP